jgi:SAM-dependent methyltransferase
VKHVAEDELSLGLFRPLTVGEDFWNAARRDVDEIIEHTGLAAGSNVLIIPRGAGQHAIAFAERGMSVCAVGPDDDLMALASGRAQDLELDVRFAVDQSEVFEADLEFDLVANLSSSFDFVQAGDNPANILTQIQSSLREDGWLVLRMVSMDGDRRRVSPRDWSEKEGVLICEELEYTWDIGWVSYRWLIVTPDGRRYEFHLGHQGYDSEALAGTVGESGFRDVTLFGSLDGEPFAGDTPLIIYARK